MKDLECKLNQLKNMLREDGYNTSNIVIQTLNEAQEIVKLFDVHNVMNTEKFLDWLVELDIAFYKTTKEPDYTPSGNSHFYLKGSQERFTSKDMIDIFTNKASDEINENWQYAIAENIAWQKRQC